MNDDPRLEATKRIARKAADRALALPTPPANGPEGLDVGTWLAAEIAAEEIASARDWVEFEIEIPAPSTIGAPGMKLSQVTVDWNSVAPEKPIERVKPLVTIIAPADRSDLDRSLARVHPEHPFRKGLPEAGAPSDAGKRIVEP